MPTHSRASRGQRRFKLLDSRADDQAGLRLTNQKPPIACLARFLKSGLAVLLAGLIGAVQAQLAADPPAEERFRNWLEAFNSRDPARLETFIHQAFPSLHSPLALMIESAKATGGFEVVELERVDNSEVVALVRERDWPGAYGRIALTLEPQPSNLIHDIALSRARPPASAAPIPRISEAEALSALREKLDQASADSLFSGAIIVARNGARVLEFASGKADRERGIPNTVDTRFRIGSMNKMFTAVAVLQLVEDGRVQLSAPVGAYLSDYPNEKVAEQVTVEHLLTHTGGTGDIFGPEFAEHRAELREHADYLALAGERDPAFTPGSRFAYSNYGYILLGAIIEAVTDRSYYDYVRANIFAPAGMEDTGSLPENVDVPGRAVGYSTLSGRWRSVADTLPYRGTAAGGGYSTVGDLIAFSQALHSGVLLNDETLETATETESELGPGTGYGYGFYEFDVNGVRAFGHGGAAAGMDAQLIVYPQSGYAVAVAANRDAGVTRRLADFVGRRLPVDPPAP